MSLADELMADLASEEEEEEAKDVDIHGPEGQQQSAQPLRDLNDQVANTVNELQQGDQDVTTERIVANLNFTGTDLASIATLMKKLSPLMDKIRSDVTMPENVGEVQLHPTYQLLVDANNYSLDIDNEVLIIHKYIKDLYSKRFAELEKLIPSPMDYAATVKKLGNDVDRDLSHLKQVLPAATVMVVTMSAYDNIGTELSEHEMDQVTKACELLLELVQAKQEITDFVSTRLSVFAPNITQIVSPDIAAQILGWVGGLEGLCKMNNSNIPALGSKRQVGVGLGQTGRQRRGFLYYCDLVQYMPEDVRSKALKKVAGKLVLAARLDLQHAKPDGSSGYAWRQELKENLEKMIEPPEVTKTKALPKPAEKQGKRRGGRRFRKLREQMGETEFQRAQNRVGFNDQLGDYGDDEDNVVTMRNAKLAGVATVRANNVNRSKLNKKNQARMENLNKQQQNISIEEALNNESDSKLLDPNAAAPSKRKLDLPAPASKRQK